MKTEFEIAIEIILGESPRVVPEETSSQLVELVHHGIPRSDDQLPDQVLHHQEGEEPCDR